MTSSNTSIFWRNWENKTQSCKLIFCSWFICFTYMHLFECWFFYLMHYTNAKSQAWSYILQIFDLLANFYIENVKTMLKFVYIINFKYVKVGMSIIFIAWSSCSAGIRLDSIPAPYENFLPSIEQKHDNLVSPTPKLSPNPTPFSFSI